MIETFNPTLQETRDNKMKQVMNSVFLLIFTFICVCIFTNVEEPKTPFKDISITNIVVLNKDGGSSIVENNDVGTMINNLKIYRNSPDIDKTDYQYQLLFEDENGQKYELYIGSGKVMDGSGTYRTKYEYTDKLKNLLDKK